MQGTCRFCGNKTDLCHSHIIPELCYLAAYDPLHRATKFQAEPNQQKLIQKSLREYLLCKDCEGKFSKWESAFKTFWFGTPALPQKMADDYFVIKGFDYREFKLFHLSILWRASVASGPEFNTVSLGALENTIRQMLDNEDPGPEDHYPMFGLVLLDDQREVAYGLVGKPQHSEFDNRQAYYASYAGVEWAIIMTTDTSSPEMKELLPLTMKKNGEMYLATAPLLASATLKIFAEQHQDAVGSTGAGPSTGT